LKALALAKPIDSEGTPPIAALPHATNPEIATATRQPLTARSPETQPSLTDAARPPEEPDSPEVRIEVEEDAVTVNIRNAAQIPVPIVSAIAPPVVLANPIPLIPEVEPSDLFDEDFEPPPAKPIATTSSVSRSTELDSLLPRPAAGTPAPPSVIISHPPPSIPEAPAAQSVLSMPEETRPALRSIRVPGTIQVSIGSLFIGALLLVVLVLLAVLLLRLYK
jgi:hypothetical protein